MPAFQSSQAPLCPARLDFESKISDAIDGEIKKSSNQPNVQLIMTAALVAALAFQLYLRRGERAARKKREEAIRKLEQEARGEDAQGIPPDLTADGEATTAGVTTEAKKDQ